VQHYLYRKTKQLIRILFFVKYVYLFFTIDFVVNDVTASFIAQFGHSAAKFVAHQLCQVKMCGGDALESTFATGGVARFVPQTSH